MAYESEDDKPVGTLTDEQKLKRFKDWLKLSADAESKQRQREREDIAFQRPENQWPDQAKKDRAGRPMLSISLLKQPMQLVQNQAANAQLGVTLTAIDERSTSELAEIKQGLSQRIQRDGLAHQARLWALDRAKQAGRGWYRINTQYDEDSDNPSDQEIVFERILYQEMVYPDPAATKPDFSDGRFCFVAAYVPCDTFHERYPQAQKYTSGDFAELMDAEPEWVRSGATKDPMVAECFYKVTTHEDVSLEARGGKYERRKEIVKVWRAVLSGCEILEDEEWAGGRKYIPIVPVIGQELQPIDGERQWEGMVRGARDGQMAFNYAISSMVEDVGRLSKAPYVGVEGQFEGHEKEWDEANRKNLPYLEYKNVDLAGKPAPAPQPMQIDGTKMQLSMQLSEKSQSLVQISTAVYEPSLGDFQQGAKGQSGKAIQALQQQADAGTGNYLGNLKEISMPYEARVVLDLMPYVYDRPGRITQVLGDEDKTKTVMLNAPFVMDSNGRPVPAQEGQPGAKTYNLAEGKYGIAVNVGRSFQTRLQQGAEEMGQILQALPPEMQVVLLPTYMRFKDTPGAKETADLLTKFRDMKFPGLADKEGEQPTPDQLKAQLAAAQQQIQEMGMKLKQATDLLQIDAQKQQATIQKAQMDAQAKDAQGQLEAVVKQKLAEFEAAHEVALENDKQQAAMALEAMKLEFERWKVQFQAAHEVGMGAAQGNTSKMVRDRGQSNDSEQGQESGQEMSRGSSESYETPPEDPSV